jgi:hypothetical protein
LYVRHRQTIFNDRGVLICNGQAFFGVLDVERFFCF